MASRLTLSLPTLSHTQFPCILKNSTDQRHKTTQAFAAKPGGFSLNSILNSCKNCGGKGAIECPGCKGTGKNKKNGNIFERWNCI
ncbi:uncharacterized protein LOC112489845 isoform X2 [Ziziphus jujuba]|uniref:Uncharacterized protein LOC112489845 isoform X2 n=1 Tax=Ziziphus jujuba TaxID=326968 RepID=A0ABM3IN74_ZIZJJ|nr:uncharacterized protein LOC112489845 isoform X2 [Ziziphus jujuba]